jgi:tetratricopeptide (TPR) repeat protein
MFPVIARTLADVEVDERPSPWVLYGILVGLGVFLLHNLVDFSLFEAGPMFLFALLAGSAVGMRETSDGRGLVLNKPLVAAALTGVAWLAAAGTLVAPVLMAESSLRAGDEFLRTSQFEQAIRAYQDAAATVPYNGEYPYRIMQMLRLGTGTGSASLARGALDSAIRANPLGAGYYASRAELEARQPRPDVDRVRFDYGQSLALDPENVEIRLDYARTLAALHLPAQAREQYEKALWYNDQLAPDEIERLSPDRLEEIHAAIAKLRPSTAPATAPATQPK